MANIDELHWSAILDTKDFDAKAEYLRKEAKRLNVELSKMLDIYQKFKGKTLITEKGVENAKQMSEVLSEIKKKMDSLPASVKVYERGTENVNRSLDGTNARYREQSKLLRQLTTLAGTYFSVRGVQSFLKSLIDITGQFEVQKMALTSMLQSSQVADRIFNEYRQLALNSPYTFQDFTKFGKQLTAFNIPANQLVDTTKMLADVAAGLGVDMGRIILAYGQIKSAGVLKGTELRQLTEAGVPILESLAKQIEETTGKTVKLAEVFQMISKKQIPFEMVEKAFRDMTSEGGKFYNMQEVLVETLQGKIGKLRDVWQQALYDLGSANDGVLKGAVDLAIKLVGHLDQIAAAVAPIVVGFGAYGSALAAVAVGQKALDLWNFAKALVAVRKGSEAASSALVMMGGAAKGAALALGFIVALGFTIYEVYKNTTRLKRSLDDIVSGGELEMNQKIDQFNELADKLKKASKGSQDYRDAIHELNTKYGEYLPNLLTEKNALDEIKKSADAAALAIRNKARASAEEKGINAIENEFGRTRNKRTLNLVGGLYNLMAENSPFSFKNLEKSKDEIKEFVSEFKDEIEKAIDEGTIDEMGKNLQESFSLSFARKFNEGLDPKLYSAISSDVRAFFNVIRDMADEKSELSDILDVNFGSQYSSKEHADMEKKILADYENRLAYINSQVLSEVEYAKAIKKAEEIRDKELEEMYKKLGIPMPKKESNGIDTTIAPNTTDEENKIKKRISNLLKLKDTYDKLVQNPLVGEETARALMGRFYNETDTDYIKRINDELEVLLKLNPKLQEYAEGIRQSFGKDAADEFLKSVGGIDKVKEKIRDFLSQDFGVEGEKAVYKISKAITDMFNKNSKLDNWLSDTIKEFDATKDVYMELFMATNKSKFQSESEQKRAAETYWTVYRAKMVGTLNAQAKMQKEYNKKAAIEAVRTYVGTDFKEQMSSFDLTNWGDKNVSEIRRIRKAVKEIRLSPEAIAQLGKVEGGLATAEKELSNIKANLINNTINPAEMEAWAKGVNNAASALSTVATAMKKISVASENGALQDIADATFAISQNLSAAAAGYQLAQSMGAQQYSWIGAVAGGLLDIVGQVSDADAEQKKSAKEIRMTIRNIRSDVDAINFDKSLSFGVNSIFGENTIARLNNLSDALGRLRDNQRSAFEMMRAYYNYNPNVKGYEDTIFVVKDMTFWKSGQIENLKDIAEELNMTLFDDNGFLNPELIDRVIELYGNLNEEQLEWLNAAKDAAERYRDVLEEIDTIVADMFGSVADDMVDAFLDNFKEMGNAVEDLGDTFTNLGETIVKSMLKSYVLDTILKKYEDEARKMMADYATGGISYDELAGRVSAFAESVAEETRIAGDVINAMLEAFQSRGLLGDGEDKETLASGIKGITEDTASLLASYINAMRADLSYVRMMQEKGWADVSGIYEAMGAFPTLNDHLAQVAADAHDMALSNRQILTELQSVITSASGRRSIAVDVQ